MTRGAQVKLTDGRLLDYEIRVSARAKSIRLKLTVRDGLTVFVPKGFPRKQLSEIVSDKKDWITTKLTQFDQVRTVLGEMPTSRPQAFDLTAAAETWRVEYRESKSTTIAARSEQVGRLLVYGAIDNSEQCNAAIRRWLARRAKEHLGDRLHRLSDETGLTFSRFTIKNQKTRWGSCSSTGVVSLNCKLMFLPPELVRYVIVHELCHLIEPNHSNRFWTHLRQYEPDTDRLHERIAEGWKHIPPWAHNTTS